MRDVGPGPGEVGSLLVFVDRLGAAGTDRAAALAHDRVRRAVGAGSPPAGVRRIAEGLSAAAAELPPPPRRPADDPGSLVAAARDNALLVLDDVEPGEVAAAVAALVDDGRRVIVTAADTAMLEAVRVGLPAGVTDRVVDALPDLAPADLHRLRGLLATSTPARRARLGQQLPELSALPDPPEVAALCAVAVRRSSPGTELIAPLLAELDADRRKAVVAVAQCVQRSLSTLATHSEPWVWDLLGDLVHGRRRPAFDALVQSAAQALATIDDGRDDPPVRITGPLPEGAVDALVAYLDFREAGGRARGPFRPVVQRDAEPVLRVIRVGDRRPETAADLRIVLTHFELGERLVTVDADCAELDLPTPQNPTELEALSSALIDVGAAARSVGALRHDMLFLDSSSPVAVPDVAAAEQIALAVLDYDEHGSAAEAAQKLDELAAGLAALVPAAVTAPEHSRAVAALQARDAAGYAAAADELVGAYREQYDEQRAAALLTALGSETLARAWNGGAKPGPEARPHRLAMSPGLAPPEEGWSGPKARPHGPAEFPGLAPPEGGSGPGPATRPHGAAQLPGLTLPGGGEGPGSGARRFGFAWFTRTEPLLAELPEADRADVVVVLDAGNVGLDRALLAAAAPRLVAAVTSGGRSGPGTLLGLLQRASALVIRGRAAGTTGRVVPLTGARSVPPAGRGGVEQAGA